MTDITNNHRRASDHSRTLALNQWFVNRGFLVWIATALLGVAGFYFQIKDLPSRVASLESKVEVLSQNAIAVTKLQCFNEAYTMDQLYLVGIDCRELRGIEKNTPGRAP